MTSSLIDQAFKKCKAEGRPALITYTVAGDPTKKKSLEIIRNKKKMKRKRNRKRKEEKEEEEKENKEEEAPEYEEYEEEQEGE